MHASPRSLTMLCLCWITHPDQHDAPTPLPALGMHPTACSTAWTASCTLTTPQSPSSSTSSRDPGSSTSELVTMWQCACMVGKRPEATPCKRRPFALACFLQLRGSQAVT